MPLRDSLMALAVVVIWGLNFVAAKLGVAEIPGMAFTALRFALVAALVVPFTRPARAHLPGIALMSLTFGTLHFGLLFTGIRDMDGATAAILIQLGVPFTTLLGVLVLKERLGPWRLGGLVLAFSGSAVLAGEPTLPALGPFLLVVGGAFAWASSNVLAKVVPTIKEVPALTLVGWLSLMAVPQVAALSWLIEDGQVAAVRAASWTAWGAMLYTALAASIVAHTLWYALLRRHTLVAVVPYSLMAPVIGIVASIVLLGEAATWQKAVGGCLTLAGVGIILWRQAAKAPAVLRDPAPEP